MSLDAKFEQNLEFEGNLNFEFSSYKHYEYGVGKNVHMCLQSQHLSRLIFSLIRLFQVLHTNF